MCRQLERIKERRDKKMRRRKREEKERENQVSFNIKFKILFSNLKGIKILCNFLSMYNLNRNRQNKWIFVNLIISFILPEILHEQYLQGLPIVSIPLQIILYN